MYLCENVFRAYAQMWYNHAMKRNIMPSPRKVLVDISLLHASGRDIVSGIFRHIEANCRWELKLFQSEENPLTPEKIDAAVADGVAGIIMTSVHSTDVERALARTTVPVVLIGVRNKVIETRRSGVATIRNDNNGIGTMGAEYFARHGQFRTFGFVSAGSGLDWSSEREMAFAETIARYGKRIEVFRTAASPGSEDDRRDLAKWLASLPAPTALMAACDWRNEHVLGACKEIGMDVPGKISLIGVDNDEFVCSHTAPSLSSILPNHEEMGASAAATLDRMMAGRRFTASITIPPKRIVERESSSFIPPSTMLVERALNFISANACDGIAVADVVRHLNVSRRLAELRFKEIEGRTMRDAIESVRLERLTSLLVGTRRPIAAIAHECGFQNPNAIEHLFKKRFGISMREYRHTFS